jgi:uncharacterized RDD family membrane protein YckC
MFPEGIGIYRSSKVTNPINAKIQWGLVLPKKFRITASRAGRYYLLAGLYIPGSATAERLIANYATYDSRHMIIEWYNHFIYHFPNLINESIQQSEDNMQSATLQPLSIPSVMTSQMSVSYAGFWKRLGASIIDQIILSIVHFIVILPLVGFLGVSLFSPGIDINTLNSDGLLITFLEMYLTSIVALFTIEWLYFALMESTRGATLGKMLFRIQVSDLDGFSVSFGRATARYFSKILSSLTFGIGYIMAGFTVRKQALHDIVSGCLVIDR